MKIVKLKEFYEFMKLPKSFTGVIHWQDEESDIWYVKKRTLHRELGPACHGPDGVEIFFLEGQHFTPKEYWTVMLEKYRYTKNEAICLAGLLSKE